MSVTLTLKSLEKHDWFKVVKVFFYAAVSLALAYIPAHFAHNVQYLALVAPINALLVGIRQTVKQEEANSLAALPAGQQTLVADVMNGVDQITQPTVPEVTTTTTVTPVVPVAPETPTTPVVPGAV